MIKASNNITISKLTWGWCQEAYVVQFLHRYILVSVLASAQVLLSIQIEEHLNTVFKPTHYVKRQKEIALDNGKYHRLRII